MSQELTWAQILLLPKFTLKVTSTVPLVNINLIIIFLLAFVNVGSVRVVFRINDIN